MEDARRASFHLNIIQISICDTFKLKKLIIISQTIISLSIHIHIFCKKLFDDINYNDIVYLSLKLILMFFNFRNNLYRKNRILFKNNLI